MSDQICYRTRTDIDLARQSNNGGVGYPQQERAQAMANQLVRPARADEVSLDGRRARNWT
jgi:hypothetical protein